MIDVSIISHSFESVNIQHLQSSPHLQPEAQLQGPIILILVAELVLVELWKFEVFELILGV